MPQWDRDRAERSYPDERWQAVCPPYAVPLLLRYDHHTVWIGSRPALLLTYQWTLDPAAIPDVRQMLTVSFTHPAGHPKAPAEVQSIVDQLTFTPVENPERSVTKKP